MFPIFSSFVPDCVVRTFHLPVDCNHLICLPFVFSEATIPVSYKCHMGLGKYFMLITYVVLTGIGVGVYSVMN